MSVECLGAEVASSTGLGAPARVVEISMMEPGRHVRGLCGSPGGAAGAREGVMEGLGEQGRVFKSDSVPPTSEKETASDGTSGENSFPFSLVGSLLAS